VYACTRVTEPYCLPLFYSLKRGQGTRGDILLAPAAPGEIILLHLDGSVEWALQKGAFLASDASIDIGVKVHCDGRCVLLCHGVYNVNDYDNNTNYSFPVRRLGVYRDDLMIIR
jgi:hypothetical protein